MDSSHPLLPLIKTALRQQEGHRPPSDNISYNLTELKADRAFLDSRQRQERGEEGGAASEEIQQMGRQLSESRKEVERLRKQLRGVPQQHATTPRFVRKDAAQEKLKAVKRRSFHLEEKDDTSPTMYGASVPAYTNTFLQDKSEDILGQYRSQDPILQDVDERQEGDGMNTFEIVGTSDLLKEEVDGATAKTDSWTEEVSVPGPALQTGSLGSAKKRKWSLLRKSSTLPDMHDMPNSPTPTLTVRVGTSAVSAMVRGYSAVTTDGKAYFTAFSSSDKRIYSCKLHAHSKSLSWMVVPECPHFEFGLVIVNDSITAVGGYKQEYRPSQPTNCLLTYNEVRRQWSERFPPMQNKRRLPAVVTTPSLLVVAGGNGNHNEILGTAEVMNLQTLKWVTVGSLPIPLTHATATVNGANIHIAGG